jgi:flagellum-specific peptidoglycan hydrolase FlgJ
MKRFLTGIAAAAMLSSVAVPVINNTTNHHQVRKAQASTASSFLSTAAKQAQRAAKKYGVYPSVMISQAIVESAWGQSGLALKSNNLFGMKADDNWKGSVVKMPTQEWNGKRYITIKAPFRAYANYEQSFEDNGKKLRLGVSWQPTRYQGAWIEKASSYRAATKALTGTYATSPTYNTTLNSRITAYNLTQYDPKISNAKKTMYVKSSGSTYAWPTDHSVTSANGSVTVGQKVTVAKTIKYYDGSARYYIKGLGWINDNHLTTSSNTSTSTDEQKKQSNSTQAPKTQEKAKKVMHNAYIYNAKGKRVKHGLIREDTTITTFGTKKIKGVRYYRVGKDSYIKAGNVDATKRKLRHNAYTYDQNGSRIRVKTLKRGQRVATYGGTKKIKGIRYYKIAVDEYVKAANF